MRLMKGVRMVDFALLAWVAENHKVDLWVSEFGSCIGRRRREKVWGRVQVR